MGAPLGRELEIASLLGFIKNNGIRNVVWVTATSTTRRLTLYDPARAAFSDFTPFWEFVAGPINAGTFGPNEIDRTFGPEVKYVSVPAGMKQNRPPSDGIAVLRARPDRRRHRSPHRQPARPHRKALYRIDLQPA